MSELKLVSFNLCPFVQRSVITLREKRAVFDIEYIDLSDRPGWFNEASPLGKVPLLITHGAVLFESAVINEYIDETVGERLLPSDPLQRAQHRMWIEFGSSLIADVWRAQSTRDSDNYEAAEQSIRAKFSTLDSQTVGPFFYGEAFSLVDAAIAPALQRLAWMSEMDARFVLISEYPNVERWWNTLKHRESVKASVLPDIQEHFGQMITALGGVLSQQQ